MRIESVGPVEYGRLFSRPSHIYNAVGFNELNRTKCDSIRYLVFRDDRERVRFGLIAGERDGSLRSPFSAPFGGMESSGSQRTIKWVEAAEALRDYLGQTTLRVILPPLAYDRDGSVTKQLLALQGAGGRVKWNDYNYHLDLRFFTDGYLSSLDCKVRNTYKVSLNQGFVFTPMPSASADEIAEAHRIILANHRALGYPVHLSAEDLVSTSRVIPIDAFMVSLDGVNVSSAIVYHNAPGACQLIYWGDLGEYRSKRPMNFLAYNLFAHYASIPEIDIFDMGPSSSEGIPSRGLCAFKEGLGCTLTSKITIEL